ncbi:Fatty acid desaturase; Delta-9 fatty acid desaturase [hydrothermal vent metagenome]|uniref:Fatty acid desaturase Delta-9 fatty acid desaturase n=1 Tax=hydrothermal vent metagenome TaxID=652676 RepID=A0A3B1DY34_9ZZZZ
MEQAVNQVITPKSDPAKAEVKQIVDYPTLILLSLVCLVALVGVPLFGYFVGYTTFDWVLFVIFYIVTGLGITVGYHRLFSHRSFTCKTWVKLYFLITGGWAMENSALKWCSDHIRHHAKTDTDEDPYNAKRGFWYSHVVWIFKKDPSGDLPIREKYKTALRKDKWIMWQYNNYLLVVLSGIALPVLLGFIHRGWTGAASAFLLAGVLRLFLVLNSTFFINSICHIWGSQPYGDANTSRDNWWISLITFGEGYHNYHHNFPRDYRNGPKWYNFDPSKWLIFSLFLIGSAKKA